jgi:hypothetical protein
VVSIIFQLFIPRVSGGALGSKGGQPPQIVPGAPTSAERKRLMSLVEDFFQHNFRDITSRDSLEWGNVTTDAKGNDSIRYKYHAKIWDKDTITNDQVFTFDSNDKFVSVKDVHTNPEEREQARGGKPYVQQQLVLAEAGNYWAKFNLWEAYAKGKHEVDKNPAEADKWLSELVEGTYLAKFEPVNGFAPKTPKEMLHKFNESCQLRSTRVGLGGASFFRTTKQGDKLIGSFLTATPDEFKAALEKNPNLKLISVEKVTRETFLAHEASGQELL